MLRNFYIGVLKRCYLCFERKEANTSPAFLLPHLDSRQNTSNQNNSVKTRKPAMQLCMYILNNMLILSRSLCLNDEQDQSQNQLTEFFRGDKRKIQATQT